MKKREHYWSLVIEPGWVQTSCWTITEDQKVMILVTSPPSHWEEDSDLAEVVDTSLSTAIQNLPEDVPEPSKTILGLSPSWVSEGRIKPEHLDKIKKLCTKLSLDPVGFVVLPEAIAFFVKTEEGSALNAIVVGVGERYLDITIFSFGNFVGTLTVGRSVSVAEDVIEGLVGIKVSSQLPSRFLIYDGKEGELQEIKQSLTSADWQDYSDRVKFLHTPKIEIIDPEQKAVAVSLAGASEIAGVKVVEYGQQEKKIKEELKEEISEQDLSEASADAESVGFVQERDIKEIEKDFPKPKDISEEVQVPRVRALKMPGVFQNISELVNRVLPTRLSTRGFPDLGKKTFFFGIGFLVLIFVAFILAWLFLPKASVTIYVTSQKLEEAKKITIDPDVQVADFEKAVVAGSFSDKVNVSSEKTVSTTGVAKVGEKARGKVIIRNGTSSEISLEENTVLTGPNSLKFLLDSSVSVPAADSPSSPGTALVEANAESIGSEYNLAKDESFQVSNYPKSEVDGVAESDFSGGSSREVAVVSEDDRLSLEKNLSEELLEKGKAQIVDNLSSNQLSIENSIEFEVVEKNFSAKVGDEATNLKLSMSMDLKGLVVSKNDLQDLAKKFLENQVPQGYVLRSEQIEIGFGSLQKEDGAWSVEAIFVANLLPEIKTEEIAAKITGKYPTVAQNYLSTIAGYSSAKIRLNPPFPGRLGTLPKITKNISIEIVAQN